MRQLDIVSQNKLSEIIVKQPKLKIINTVILDETDTLNVEWINNTGEYIELHSVTLRVSNTTYTEALVVLYDITPALIGVFGFELYPYQSAYRRGSCYGVKGLIVPPNYTIRVSFGVSTSIYVYINYFI